jgi:NADH:ubiquinone reductase (non-electrogenic)
MASTHKPSVVVLGTGFAGFSFIKRVDLKSLAVTVVSPRNYFLFTPLLPSTTVGTIEFRSIIEPVRAARKGITYYHASCTGIDGHGRTITCEGVFDKRPFSLAFDYLVIAVGGRSNTYNIAGVEEHALFLKDLADARLIRQRIIANFEQAANPAVPEEERRRLLHFVVVGGGPTGVEFAAEMHDFLTEDLRKSFRALMPLVRITVLEASDHILNSFDAMLSDYTLRLFQRQRIDVRTQSLVTRVEEGAIYLQDGAKIPCGLVIWSTGIGPVALVQSLDAPKDQYGRILVDEFLRVEGFSSVYAAGDCATIRGNVVPATAQVAQQQGTYLAAELLHRSRGKPAKPFRYRHYGMLAYIGSGRALADLAAYKGKGFSTWLFWRSAYLTKLVSLKNKMLVLFDWFKTFVFGRDISRF